jgi:hypothetical protein
VALAAPQGPAAAQDAASVESRLDALREELKAQRELIAAQSLRIESQQQEIERLRGVVIGAADLDAERGGRLARGAPPFANFPSPDFQSPAGAGLIQAQPDLPNGIARAIPDRPVGEDPNLPRVENVVAAVPEGQGVLTRPGKLVFEPSLEYSNSSKNRLVFRGIELIPGIQIGVLEANEVDRNTFVGTMTLRYGLAKNLEIEGRVPFLYRTDRIQFVQQREESLVREVHPKESNIGDIEMAVRYQLNRPLGQRPIFVASLRVKSNTGRSPFEIPFDEFGIATGLATGSGFWAVQPGVQFLLPSDPAVIFGGVSYNYHIAQTVDRTVGGVLIGRVDPGDAINANLGFGFALNPRFSFSLGYRHSFIFPTETELGSTRQRSSRLHVGAFSFGMSYRLTQRRTLNFAVDVGTTADAPNVGLSLRMPFELN